MRNLPIAYGDSCFAVKWSNKVISFDDLAERLKTPVRTTETVSEYAKMRKADRDRAKDRGGFVAGQLKGGRRKRETVGSRSMLTLDLDQATTSFLPNFKATCEYAALVYSTHSHTPEAPRLRVVVPLSRDVTPDEYQAISRYFADEWGIDMFDECSYRPHQLMYWPTVSADGEYIFERVDGEWLDPDAYLAKHPNWRDCALLPTSSRESGVRGFDSRKQEDPLKKRGIVGAFCRAYTITAAIATFLDGVYAPTASANRYDFIGSDSMPGVQVYDDRWIYSHHANDPACGMLLNAFDAVRVHKFGDDDPRKSFDEMSEFALNDPEVKSVLARERVEASEDFEGADLDWQNGLELNKQGKIRETLPNMVLIMRNDPKLMPLRYNMQRNAIDAKEQDKLPWKQLKPGWNDTDDDSLRVYLNQAYGVYAPEKTRTALFAVASERAYHPIREYLDSLPAWDRVPRLDTVFSDYLGTPINAYTMAVCRKTFTAAVARIYKPGTKFDSAAILIGRQGLGKSTLFKKLAGDWFSDALTMTDMRDKTAAEKLQGYWILELGELAGMRKAEVETVKAFMSRDDDKYRAAYGANVESHPRQCVIVGSTNNEDGFLRDVTGNRRFWPLKTGEAREHTPWELDQATVDQIWAEAITAFRNGEKLYLEGAEAEMAEAEQQGAMEMDEREGLVRQYLETLLPAEWNSMSIGERRNFILGDGDIGKVGTLPRESVCTMEIWCECFGQEPSRLRKQDSYEIAGIMRRIEGWERGGGKRIPLYGYQKIYAREV